MFDVAPIFQCLALSLDAVTYRQLNIIISALFAMSGRVTMLGISRWTEEGGSYRTIQRFFNRAVAWSELNWLLFRTFFFDPWDVFIIAGDETVVTKAGRKTHGLDRFFSSLYGRRVPGLSFFALSLVSIKRRTSYPLKIKQIVRSETEKKPAAKSQPQPKAKGKRGRPKGSKNKNKKDVELSPYLTFVQGVLQTALTLIGTVLSVSYVVLDGAFGHNEAMQMAHRCNLFVISKLQHNAALFFPCEAPYSGRGAPKKYGNKIDYDNLPAKHRVATSIEKSIRTDIYNMTMLHKRFPQKLNIAIIHKTNLKTGATAHVVLFSSDLDVSYDKVIDYYKLRFQIEFNFRDAKQYWGLEDFMNVAETPVTNAANLAFLMVNVAEALLQGPRKENRSLSVLDIKAYFRGFKYVVEILKLLPKKPDRILIQRINDQITQLGSINAT